MTLEEYQKRVFEKNENAIVLEYKGQEKKAKFQCKKCGFIWESSASSMISNGKQCPNCEHYYNGERKIKNVLDKWVIKYESQFRFKNCRDKYPLPFDFYLPNDNVCIEYDGQQHFVQRQGWTDLKEIQKHDNIKNLFCKKQNIPLIRIPYWDEEDIEWILFNEFVKLNILEEIVNTD